MLCSTHMPEIFIGSDHRGLKKKDALLPFLREQGLDPVDLTPELNDEGRIDYPLVGKAVAERVARQKGLGILVCGSGVGVAIAANRFRGVRAAVAHSAEEIVIAKAHDHINLLSMGSDNLTLEQMQEFIQTWLAAKEDRIERRVRRAEQLDQYGS